MLSFSLSWLLIISVSSLVYSNLNSAEARCDKEFTFPGMFKAPNRIDRKQSTGSDQNQDALKNFKPIHCVYKFIGQADQRVSINITTSKLRGAEPECNNEYVDIYLKFNSTDAPETLGAPDGRFCTTLLPRRLISLYNVLLLVLHSDYDSPMTISGNHDFIDWKGTEQIGPPTPGTLCTHTINSSERRDGEFQSVTYPGIYTKGLKCSYRFVGLPGFRIRLEFLDLDMFSGGPHCPLDSIKVYDGATENDPIINTICGSHRSLIIFSTSHDMLLTMTTTIRDDDIYNRGFSTFFEFSDKFVDPSFIQGHNAKHIRGSECDQRVITSRGSSGLIRAPDPGHHPNAICRYAFEGLQTSLEYERVALKFRKFDLRSPISTGYSGEQCNDSYVRIYTAEQKPDQKHDPNDYDYAFCGDEIPQMVDSDAASMLMEYNSGLAGGKFEAEYKFIVDYRIQGHQSGSGCDYDYRSEFMKSGTFNSPRHPSWYLNNVNCTYTFVTKPNEFLLIQFGTFKMAGTLPENVLAYNQLCKGHDSVQILEISMDSNEQKILDQTEIGTFCGVTTPGPIMSYRQMRINFRTNQEQVHYGFSATYNFYSIADLKSNEFVTNCGGQIFASQTLRSGTFTSPATYRPETYEKRNHICSWNITARPAHRISLTFSRFELEGSPNVRGCITASVRIVTGRSKLPVEICGLAVPINGTAHHFVSEAESLTVTFISTKHASGSNGFDATWSETKKLG